MKKEQNPPTKKKPQAQPSTRKTSFAEELNSVPIESVATLAVTLLQRDSVTPAEATSKAFELLELAAAGKRAVAEKSEWQDGIDRVEASKAKWADWRDDNTVADIDRERDSLPIKAVLEALMPDKRSVKPAEREPRLRHWIMAAYQCDNLQAADILAAWKREGVPQQAFQHLRLTWANWWRESKGETRRQTGKAGAAKRAAQAEEGAKAEAKAEDAAKTKGRKGRVRRSDDKRLGAKTGGLRKALNKSS